VPAFLAVYLGKNDIPLLHCTKFSLPLHRIQDFLHNAAA